MNAAVNNSRTGVLRNAFSVEGLEARKQRNTQPATALPSISPLLLRVFSAYSRWYVSRQFHSIRISRAGEIPNLTGIPLLVYANHASWWDPLICLMLQNQFFANRLAFAPMDAAALRQYRFFANLGFFGVEQNSVRGAATFIRTAGAILNTPDTILWLTPQGRFADVRERPVRFKSGLGHLPARIDRAAFVPLALEYTHWEERKPEVLCRFGAAQMFGRKAGQCSVAGIEWTRHFAEQLEATQDALAAEVQQRQREDFEVLLRGRAGVGFFYDAWRALRAGLSGQKFQREHCKL